MASTKPDEILASVLDSLKGTKYECVPPAKSLSGGTTNFLFEAQLVRPIESFSSRDVVLKHSEGFVASNPNFKVAKKRARTEVACLKAVAARYAPARESPPQHGVLEFHVHVPAHIWYDEATSTQIQEFIPGAMNLKAYALKYLGPNTSADLRPQCLLLGIALGNWLRMFHSWSLPSSQSPLELAPVSAAAADNIEMQKLKHTINYEWLLQRIDQFPDILSEAKDIFNEVRQMAAAELQDWNSTSHRAIHGDFWTGNVLLADEPIDRTTTTRLWVIDFEMVQIGVSNLDLGQMIAEMYELWLYKKMEAGKWLVEGLMEGYTKSGTSPGDSQGTFTENFAFRTAIHVGVHLVTFGTRVQGWGSPEQVEEVARKGRDIILNAWSRDRSWFEEGEFSELFHHVDWAA